MDSTNCDLLAAILADIGASELLARLIEDGEDDGNLEAFSKNRPANLARRFKISLELAAAFVEKCRIATSDTELPAMTAALQQLGFNDIALIDKGANGVVFQCRNVADKRVVAVKFINEPRHPKEAEREGQRLRNCEHENIVRMHRVYPLYAGKCALEMDFIPGGNLRKHLLAVGSREERRLPPDAVARFTRQLLGALAYLHDEKKWMHGDIKPENILMSGCKLPVDGSPVDYSKAYIQLADFGLAKTFAEGKAEESASMLSNATSRTGILRGTQWYMSPEALHGAAHGRERCPTDDLWSACLVIMEMDTGENLQQLMIAPGSVNVEKMLLGASSRMLPLLYNGLNSDSKSRYSSACKLLRLIDASSTQQFEWQEYDGSDFVPVITAAAFFLERGFLSRSSRVMLPLPPPLDLTFDIRDLCENARCLGISNLSSGDNRPIRRMLKASVVDSGIPVWQSLVDGKEWRQCSPFKCAQLEMDFRRSHSLVEDVPQYRRLLLQPSSLCNVQIHDPFMPKPYLSPASAGDIAVMNARVHESLPEWDVDEMSQVVNQALASKYAAYRHRVAWHCNGDPNERLLFHFCPEDVIPKIWEQGDGHDPRMSRWAEVGLGAYFAEHPMYGYAYKYKLFPSPPCWTLGNEPPIGATLQLFATLVTLGQVADMGPGCESCPSAEWAEWKKEFEGYSKPTKPPLIPVTRNAAERQHLLDLMHQSAPRYDSVTSTEGHLSTHSDSSSRTPSGHKISDVMHPRLKRHACEWGRQYVVFETPASYPLFLLTLRKIRESPVDAQLLRDHGYPHSALSGNPDHDSNDTKMTMSEAEDQEVQEAIPWTLWASARTLPSEDISICSDDLEQSAQGWPPGLMDSTSAQHLHNIGVTKASSLIQAAVELDQASFNTKFGPCFFERTQEVQETLRCFLSGSQSSSNQADHQTRLQAELQNQFDQLGFQPVPWSSVQLVANAPPSSTLKTFDQVENDLFSACYYGNFPLADEILKENAIDLNAKDPNNASMPPNQTYLYAACRGPKCQPAIVELLLRNCASTKIPSGQGQNLPVHALVINFVNCTNQANAAFIPQQQFDEYFERLSEIVRVLKLYHADFNSMNAYGHSPVSELQHEPSQNYLPARIHPKYRSFLELIRNSRAIRVQVQAVVPTHPVHDADLASAYEFIRKNPELPGHTSQSISEIIWSEKCSDWTRVLGRMAQLEDEPGCGLMKFMDSAPQFKGSTLEFKLNHNQIPISLVVCNWPQDLSDSDEPQVQWQWLRPEDTAHKSIAQDAVISVDESASGYIQWSPIEDDMLIQQLKRKSTSIHFGQHRYKLSQSWFLEEDTSDVFGAGPLCGHRIRWVPDFKVAGEEDDEVDTGGCDDLVQIAIDQMQYQSSMKPISAHSALFDLSAKSVQAHAPLVTFENGKVVMITPPARFIKYQDHPAVSSQPPLPPNPDFSAPGSPPAVSRQPNQRPEAAALPPGWIECTNTVGQKYYINENTNPATTSWHPPPPSVDARREQWFAEHSFEPIPEQHFNRTIPLPKIPLRAHTSYQQDWDISGALSNTGLPITFYSSNECVARIEDGKFLVVVGPGQATIHAYQVGNEQFKPTNDWGVLASSQTLTVVELAEFDVQSTETRLKAAYPLFYTSVSSLLNLGPQHIKWAKDFKYVTIIATADKGKILAAVWAAIVGAHRVIEHFQSQGVESLKKARKALLDAINRESPWVPEDSPVSSHFGVPRVVNSIIHHINEYLLLLREECDIEIQAFEKEIDAVVDDNVGQWMQRILADFSKPEFITLYQQIFDCLLMFTRSTKALKPSMRVDVLKKYFSKKVQEFESSLRHKGRVEEDKFKSCRHVFEQFRHAIEQRVSKPGQPFLLSTLIQDFMIHLVSAGRGLNFYKESATELIDSVMKNDVTSVTTATGSGKSTLMPLLLIAANIGIKRVAVTQPRRFAAFSIYETISMYHGHSVVGYATAGESVNPMAPIVYITGGLLRTQMNLDREYSGFDCIIIDEVHERSENIDACMALLAKMKELNLKMPKVILSSATLDDKVIKPFLDAHCTFGQCKTKFVSPYTLSLHYTDRPCPKPACAVCQQLAVKTFPLSMIRFIHKNNHLYMGFGPTGPGQMLVFMPSTQEVFSTVVELKESNIIAYPLYAGQDGKTQSDSLRNGTIFISTNIAETSLTFPNLKVVIDVGKVQRPRLIDHSGKLLPAPLMETVDASKATLTQRMGRIGRTCDGHYIALYPWSSHSSRPEHIQAGLELFPSDSVRFSLSKQLRCAHSIELPFPGQPIQIDPLDPAYISFPELGSKMMADAFHASLRLGCSEDILLLAAFMMKIPPKNQILVVNRGQKLLPASAAQALPRGDISVVLEIMRRINSIVPPHTPHQPVSRKIVMDAIASWCSKHGLDLHSKCLFRAYVEFQKMQVFYLPQRPPPGCDHSKSHPLFSRMHPPKKSFDAGGKLWNGFLFGRKHADGSPDMTCRENHELRRIMRGSSMDKVVEALSFGYPDNFFVHCAELDGPVNSYSRVADRGDGGDCKGVRMKTYFILQSKSALAKADIDKFTVIFAISTLLFGAEMQDLLEPFRLGALGIAEPCTIEVLPDDPSRGVTRRIALHHDDKVPAGFDHTEITRGANMYAELRGSARSVVSRELRLRKCPELRIAKEKIKLVDATVADKLKQGQHTFKLQQLQVMKDKNVFKPLSFMWKNLYNSQLEINVGDVQDLHIKFSGRRQQLIVLKKHLEFWGLQLLHIPVLKWEVDNVFSGIQYRTPDPKNFGGAKNPEYLAFKKRLHNVTAEDLSEEYIFEMTMGKEATRESRMEAVARIALQTVECRVVGGFLRDWIVNGVRKHPHQPPATWVEVQSTYEEKQPPDHYKGWMKWDFKAGVEVVPKDIDIELMTQYFDVIRFIYEVTKYGIVVDHYEHIPQRHMFLFDKDTGPFTADFIEPHFACLHTIGDFNVSCLCVSRFPDQVGLKMEYTSSSGADHTLDVNKVIGDCRQRQLVPMQEFSKIIGERTEKMQKRGWRIMPSIMYTPKTKGMPVLMEIDKETPMFQHYAHILANPINAAQNANSAKKGKLFAMYRIHSETVDQVYSNLRKMYPTPNERLPLVDTDEFKQQLTAHPNFGKPVNGFDLFHGTKKDAVSSIMQNGFDDHFCNPDGYFGAGAYFADDPGLSMSFIDASPSHMFVCHVILGNTDETHYKTPRNSTLGRDYRPPHGVDSIKGRITNGSTLRQAEYIVYRFGQCKATYLLRFDH